MTTPGLTETTVRYLFATDWLPSGPGAHTVRVPGGSTTAVDTAGNLLQIALWNLRGRGLMEFEQIRPVAREPVAPLSGRSFARFRSTGDEAALPGLEGALLAAARQLGGGGRLAAAIDRVTGEDERGVRVLVRALGLDHRGPWNTVCGHCFAEASAAGLVRARGRLVRKVEIADTAAVEALRARHDELRAARARHLDAEPELTSAVIGDCLHAVAGSHSPSLGD